MAFKYALRPVVVAPHGMTLGGGCEVVLHGQRVVAAAESYMGQVETGAGLIPAGGGCKELVLRATDAATDELDLLNRIRHLFETIALAKVSTSAEDARRLGFLRPGDQIAMNLDRLLGDAKQTVLAMARAGVRPGAPRTDIRVPGEAAYTQMKLLIHMMRRAEHITEYEAVIAEKLAYVLSGGALNHRKRSVSSTCSTSSAKPLSACAGSERLRSASNTC
jgi:3-hydroxyacyl-CoA dehydrogenase